MTYLLAVVVDSLTTEVLGTTLAHLDDDWAFLVFRSLQCSDNSGGRGHIDSWDSKLLVVTVFEESEHIVTDDDTGLALEDVLAGRHVG
jgi:hypothetical protein